jgi:HEAT repeat protein
MGTIAFTNSTIMRLESDPAAKALAQLGDPAIPTLVGAFSGNKWSARRDAILVLRLMGSTGAIDALAQQADRESDLELKKLIAHGLVSKHTH